MTKLDDIQQAAEGACVSCGKPKRTLAQINGTEPCGDSCPNWLLAGIGPSGVKVAGCGMEAYRKLVAATVRITELEASQSAATAQLENVLDSSKEGAWMARALDAERELFALTAALKPSTVRELESALAARGDQLSAATARTSELETRVSETRRLLRKMADYVKRDNEGYDEDGKQLDALVVQVLDYLRRTHDPRSILRLAH